MSHRESGGGMPSGGSRAQQEAAQIPPNYNKLSENLRKVTPNGIQCSIFCGGRRCKYENPDNWDSAHMAIDGLYSHWVTDSILAMARPSTELIVKRHLIHQFQNLGINTIINLQISGEHASCGSPLEKSGFTYEPNKFMENNIYFYNYGWKDYGEATGMNNLLDIVKVMAFALTEGKVAVHCHAGLGRTGVLIACYLVYSLRVKANDAIRFVRLKRPNAVQTRGQILCVQEFEQFILPQCIVFCNKDFVKDKKVHEFNLTQCLNRQKIMLHGYEARTLRYIPKLIFILCERLLRLCNCQQPTSPYGVHYDISSLPFTRCFVIARIHADKSRTKFLHSNSDSTDSMGGSPYASTAVSAASTRRHSSDLEDMRASGTSQEDEDDNDDVAMAPTLSCTSPDMPSCASGMSGLDDGCLDSMLGDGICGQELHQNICFQELKQATREDNFTPCHVDEVIGALLFEHDNLSESFKKKIRQYRVELNNRSSAWTKLQVETNLFVLSGLLYEWLEHLKTPILSRDDLSYIVILGHHPSECLKKLDLASQYTIEYLLRFVARLNPISRETRLNLIKRIVASLTHQAVCIQDRTHPSGKGYPKLRKGTNKQVMEFMITLFKMIMATMPTSNDDPEPDSND